MRFEKLLIAFIIFFVFATGGALIINNQVKNYNIPIEYDYVNKTGNQSGGERVRSITEEQDDTLFGIEVSESDSESELFQGGFETVRQTRNTINLFDTISTTISQALGIPDFIITSLKTALWAIFIFTGLYMVFRFQPR
jgi:hypothetical protein